MIVLPMNLFQSPDEAGRNGIHLIMRAFLSITSEVIAPSVIFMMIII